MRTFLLAIVAVVGLSLAAPEAHARHFWYGGYGGWHGGGWGGGYYGVGYRSRGWGWGGYGLGYRGWGYGSGYGWGGYGYPYSIGYSSYGYGYPSSYGYGGWGYPYSVGYSSYPSYSYASYPSYGYAGYSSYPASVYPSYSYAPTYSVSLNPSYTTSYPTGGYSWSGSYGAVLPSYGSGYRTCGSCGLEYSSIGTPVDGTSGVTTALYPTVDNSTYVSPAGAVTTGPCTCQ